MVIKKSDWLISHHLSYRTTVSFFAVMHNGFTQN